MVSFGFVRNPIRCKEVDLFVLLSSLRFRTTKPIEFFVLWKLLMVMGYFLTVLTPSKTDLLDAKRSSDDLLGVKLGVKTRTHPKTFRQPMTIVCKNLLTNS